MPIIAKIVEIIPDVEYEGIVYEQRTVVELSTGVQIGLFDYDLHATSDMVGKEKYLSILAYIPDEAEVVNDIEPGIKPSNSNPRDWKHHIYRGLITQIGSDGTLVIDVGCGTVQVDSDVHELVETPLTKGQFLRVRTNRSDLTEIDDTA